MTVGYHSEDSISAANSLCISDHDNPRNVINLVPESVREAIKRIPSDLLEQSADELERQTPVGKWTQSDRRLRTAFWLEYERASQRPSGQMNISNIYSGVCSRPYFYTKFLQDKVRLAYLLLPPAEYEVSMEEALSFGIERLREILEMPIYQNDRPNPKIAEVILKAVAMLDQRVRGAVVQKNLNLNVNTQGNGEQKTGSTPESMEEIDRKLLELESRAQVIKKTIPADITVSGITLTEEEE